MTGALCKVQFQADLGFIQVKKASSLQSLYFAIKKMSEVLRITPRRNWMSGRDRPKAAKPSLAPA
jgi:hypothetical protein